MDQIKIRALREHLARRLESELVPSGPPESLYLRPLISRALAIVHEETESAKASSPEGKLVGKEANAGLTQLLVQPGWLLVNDPLVSSSELAHLLRTAIGAKTLSRRDCR